MKILDVKQGSGEWLKARLGVVTASEIDALVSPEGKVRVGAGPKTYLYRKVTEKLLGYSPANDVSSWAMEQGVIVESEAIPWFAFAHSVNVERVGFCTSDDARIGFSPDGIIGEAGGIEIKAPQPAKHLEYLMGGVMPAEYRSQVQFSLYVSERPWWRFVSYSRQLPPLVVNVEPDREMFKAFDQALADFWPKFDACMTRVAAMKAEHEAPYQAAHEKQNAAEEAKARELHGELPGDKWLRENGRIA